ncbi:hypothetical protein LOTGIDRAFT_238568 [Lottia gigantea]|uniref:NADP-dependent oxidoreductase domain-containing protein n=1 Tax=Lottia gigantea TaxID=225164 RepID=V4A8Y3_LOTGI|nr:hypothetical protein LOTGIDRAFT_238568 [Lottia gigantea]ESP00399.1 hypothetical protein LOTGIDRAFT_238568 [Lottia gigantea]
MANKIPTIKLNTGYDMPVLGYGTFNLFKDNEVRDACKVAIDAGYRHIDTAWVYKTENEVGDAVTSKTEEGVIKRSDLFITTKLWIAFHNPNDVEGACRDSLQKLQTDYLDLFLIHWPFAVAMEELVIKGLVRTIGVSNFNLEQLKRLLAADLRYKPAVIQVEVHPYFSNSELIEYCKKEGIVVTAYSPLGKGGAKYTSESLPNILTDEVIVKLAEKYKKSPAQIAIRWGLERGYTLVPKSVTPARIKENLKVFDFSLTKEELESINKLDRNFKVVTLDKFKTFPEYPFKWLL